MVRWFCLSIWRVQSTNIAAILSQTNICFLWSAWRTNKHSEKILPSIVFCYCCFCCWVDFYLCVCGAFLNLSILLRFSLCWFFLVSRNSLWLAFVQFIAKQATIQPTNRPTDDSRNRFEDLFIIIFLCLIVSVCV